jgi:hypothetical protein
VTTIGSGDGPVGGDRECVAGVVVEPGEDLDVGPVGEAVVGEVGLPGLVRLLGLEADVGGASVSSSALRPRDRRGARSGRSWLATRDVVVVFEVPAIVSAPASRPWALRRLRSSMIRSTVAAVWRRDGCVVAVSVARTRVTLGAVAGDEQGAAGPDVCMWRRSLARGRTPGSPSTMARGRICGCGRVCCERD